MPKVPPVTQDILDPSRGRECSKCHTWKTAEHFRSARQGKGGLHSICRPCTAAYARMKYLEDPEPHKAASRAWHKRHPERARQNRRTWNLARYGLTLEQFQAMFDAQGQGCAACQAPAPRGINWHVDHDHVTGKVRSILCHPCNTAIGLSDESPDRLLALAAYLLAHTDVLPPLPEAGPVAVGQ